MVKRYSPKMFPRITEPANGKKDQVRPVYCRQAPDFPVKMVVCKKKPERREGRIDEINTHIGNPGNDLQLKEVCPSTRNAVISDRQPQTPENQHSGQQPGFHIPAFTGYITAVQYQKHQNNSDTVCDHDGLKIHAFPTFLGKEYMAAWLIILQL